MLSELLGLPARSMGALAEAGQAKQSAAGPGGFMALAGFVMGLGDMAEQVRGQGVRFRSGARAASWPLLASSWGWATWRSRCGERVWG